MTAKDSIEVSAATVDEAVDQALSELSATQDDVLIEVLSTPRSGLLGLGSRAARVRVSRRPIEGAHSKAQSPPPAPPRPPRGQASETSRGRPPEPSRSRAPEGPRTDRPRTRAPEPPRERRPEPQRAHAEQAAAPESEPAAAADDDRQPANVEEQKREAIGILTQILELMGEKAEVILTGVDAEAIEIEIRGDGSGILIGRHGQTLDALEYLLNRLVSHKIKDAVSVVIDTEGYRARRNNQLERMALSMGERAKREHIMMKMEPLAPRVRGIVHVALMDDPLFTTRSTGDGYMR
ncbi:MAG: RNA-binding cell elongation regulator Jag/EloR, partial [Candidatus Binatales bacterium]